MESVFNRNYVLVFSITVPSSSPHYRQHHVDETGCLQVKWDPISGSARKGRILGYIVTYVTSCFEGTPDIHQGNVTVNNSTYNVTLCNLRPGLKYRLGLAGFTSKGVGPTDYRDTYAGKFCSQGHSAV